MALVQQRKKLGGDKLVRQLCTKIVDNEKITLIQIGKSLAELFTVLVIKGIF